MSGALFLARQLLAILVLPGVVAVAIPLWITQRYAVGLELPRSPPELLLALAGLPLGTVGLALFVTCVWRFAARGRGTLAPWGPPRRLVVEGPYRFVRNPMISGVVLLLFAEACLLRSTPHALWALVFLAINLAYIPLLEEPILAARFGDAYRRYCAHVPRVLPRLRPWSDGT